MFAIVFCVLQKGNPIVGAFELRANLDSAIDIALETIRTEADTELSDEDIKQILKTDKMLITEDSKSVSIFSFTKDDTGVVW